VSITGSRTEIPPSRLSPGNAFSREARLLSPEETAAWALGASDLLELYGLTLSACRIIPIRSAVRPVRGDLETVHRPRLAVSAAVAALAVTVRGRGALLDLPPDQRAAAKESLKERNDRAASCALAEGLFSVASASNSVCEIAIGEGVRKKPDERGSNPTLYAGQRFGSAGPVAYSVAVDAVEGTTKSTVAEGSSGCLLYITPAPIRRVPDLYFNRCHLYEVPGVHVDSDLREILDAIRRSRRGIDVFSLDRPRHPHALMASLGANVRTDEDGDAFPVVATGLRWGVFPDSGRYLDGVVGNIGGAAEVIASSAAAHYLGVRSSVRFAASSIARWEDRYAFSPSDVETIRAAGFDESVVYGIEDLVPGIDSADGLFVASAITDNAHIPLLDAAVWGSNFAEASVLMVGASGEASISRLSFGFASADAAARRLTPILDGLVGLPASEMKQAIRQSVSSPSGARRLRHEFAATYYRYFTETDGKLRLDMNAARADPAFAFVRDVADVVREWFD